MPARSRKQQRYLYATKGPAWVKAHHFDELAPKSSSSSPSTPKKKKKRK